VQGYKDAAASRSAAAASAVSTSAQNTKIKSSVDFAMTRWDAQVANITASGSAPTADQFEQWLQKFFKSTLPIDKTTLDLKNPTSVRDAVTKMAGHYYAGTANPASQQQSQTSQAGPKSIAGATLVHQNPDIISYGKKRYIRGDKGEWIDWQDRKQTPVPQAIGALFDKVAGVTT